MLSPQDPAHQPRTLTPVAQPQLRLGLHAHVHLPGASVDPAAEWRSLDMSIVCGTGKAGEQQIKSTCVGAEGARPVRHHGVQRSLAPTHQTKAPIRGTSNILLTTPPTHPETLSTHDSSRCNLQPPKAMEGNPGPQAPSPKPKQRPLTSITCGASDAQRLLPYRQQPLYPALQSVGDRPGPQAPSLNPPVTWLTGILSTASVHETQPVGPSSPAASAPKRSNRARKD
jgi:hypothetical protein